MKKIDIKQLFNSDWQFLIGAAAINQIPAYNYPEIAFAGASNVGKSSLINAIAGKKIAITSKTPGRTQQLNFFLLNNQLILVDMPGFGYAKAGKKQILNWQKVSLEYLAKRSNLKRVFLLIDPTKGFKQADLEAINLFNTLAVSFQLVLTKIDKITDKELQEFIAKIDNISKSWPALYPQLLMVSSFRKIRIDQIQETIIEAIKY
jgi:GTP-binding protein